MRQLLLNEVQFNSDTAGSFKQTDEVLVSRRKKMTIRIGRAFLLSHNALYTSLRVNLPLRKQL